MKIYFFSIFFHLIYYIYFIYFVLQLFLFDLIILLIKRLRKYVLSAASKITTRNYNVCVHRCDDKLKSTLELILFLSALSIIIIKAHDLKRCHVFSVLLTYSKEILFKKKKTFWIFEEMRKISKLIKNSTFLHWFI